MKNIAFSALIGLFLSGSAFAKDPFMGSYSQYPTADADYPNHLQIFALQRSDRNPQDVAAAARAQHEPLYEMDGFIEVPIPDLYWVVIEADPAAGDSDCDVGAEFKRQGNQLVYDQQGCRIVISRDAKGNISIPTFKCASCGPVNVSSKPFDYDESSPVSAIDQQNEGGFEDGY